MFAGSLTGPRAKTLGAGVALAALLALHAQELRHGLRRPWLNGHDGFNGAWVSIAARNHLTYGFGTTRLGVVRNVQPVAPKDFTFYTHHPPLMPVAVSVCFALLGEYPWTARLVAVAFSLGSLILVCLLGAQIGGRRFGLLAGFFFALLPLNAFYGQMVNHEVSTNFFALASAFFYLRWHRARHGGFLALSLAALAVGGWFGWAAYLLAAILPLHHIFAAEGDRRRDFSLILFPVVGVLSFALCVAHILWISGNTGLGDLTSAFLLRFRSDTSRIPAHLLKQWTFSWPMFLSVWLGRAWKLFTLPVLLLAAMALWDSRRYRRSDDRLFPFFLLLFGLTWVALFTQGAWEHEYWAFFCGAPAALLAAGGLLSLAGSRGDPRVVAAFAAVFAAIAVPQIRDLHRPPTKPDSVLLGAFLAMHTHQDELIVTNSWQISCPQVQYYSSRDNFDSDDVFGMEVATVEDLKRQLRSCPNRPKAVVISERDPGAEDLQAWLEPRSTSEEVFLGDRRYRIFRLSTNSLPQPAMAR